MPFRRGFLLLTCECSVVVPLLLVTSQCPPPENSRCFMLAPPTLPSGARLFVTPNTLYFCPPHTRAIRNTIVLNWTSGPRASSLPPPEKVIYVLFKLKTTTPARYVVEPRYGVILVQEDGCGNADVKITMKGSAGGAADHPAGSGGPFVVDPALSKDRFQVEFRCIFNYQEAVHRQLELALRASSVASAASVMSTATVKGGSSSHATTALGAIFDELPPPKSPDATFSAKIVLACDFSTTTPPTDSIVSTSHMMEPSYHAAPVVGPPAASATAASGQGKPLAPPAAASAPAASTAVAVTSSPPPTGRTGAPPGASTASVAPSPPSHDAAATTTMATPRREFEPKSMPVTPMTGNSKPNATAGSSHAAAAAEGGSPPDNRNSAAAVESLRSELASVQESTRRVSTEIERIKADNARLEGALRDKKRKEQAALQQAAAVEATRKQANAASVRIPILYIVVGLAVTFVVSFATAPKRQDADSLGAPHQGSIGGGGGGPEIDLQQRSNSAKAVAASPSLREDMDMMMKADEPTEDDLAATGLAPEPLHSGNNKAKK